MGGGSAAPPWAFKTPTCTKSSLGAGEWRTEGESALWWSNADGVGIRKSQGWTLTPLDMEDVSHI